MKKCLILIFGTICLCLVIFCATAESYNDISITNLMKLKLGMTKDEVINIIGEPISIEKRGSTERRIAAIYRKLYNEEISQEDSTESKLPNEYGYEIWEYGKSLRGPEYSFYFTNGRLEKWEKIEYELVPLYMPYPPY